MKTLSYVLGTEKEIEAGDELYFGQIWDGEADGEALLESGSIAVYGNGPDDFTVVDFEIKEKAENILDSIVKVISVG